MEISEFRERMRDYVVGDQSSLDDEEWWTQTTELSLLVLAERARVKRERGLANPVYRAWQARQEQPEPTPPRAHKDWGVAWFGKNGESGVCERCQLARRVYQGYNGGAHMGKFCGECQGSVLRNEA